MQTLPILMYHSLDASGSVVSVAPQIFREHMECIEDNGFRGISLSAAVDYREQHHSWPARSVVLTFDDGFANVHKSALPTLTQHGFSATVFVISGHMGGYNDWAPAPDGLGSRGILTWQQASELASAGIEIGSHTHTHPDLSRCTPAELERQISISRAEIEDHIGRPVTTFAYPYGVTTTVAKRLVARQFRAACTTVLKKANGDLLHCLPRIDMYYIGSPQKLERLLDGQLDRYLALRRFGRSARRILNSGFHKEPVAEQWC
jgi:peptidoglycan/xylan/chitin deacetylase (PgdA/CDA1 family)